MLPESGEGRDEYWEHGGCMAYLRINDSSEERKCPVYNFLIPKIKKKKKKKANF